jgi:hypothetical protein
LLSRISQFHGDSRSHTPTTTQIARGKSAVQHFSDKTKNSLRIRDIFSRFEPLEVEEAKIPSNQADVFNLGEVVKTQTATGL